MYVKEISISVQPTATSLPITGGPPPDNRKIKVKLLKLNANEPIKSGDIDTINNGKVILQNDCIPDAPSTFAASINSFGIDCKAPVVIRNIYGKPSQVLTNKTAARALSLVLSHLIGSISRISYIGANQLLITP